MNEDPTNAIFLFPQWTLDLVLLPLVMVVLSYHVPRDSRMWIQSRPHVYWGL